MMKYAFASPPTKVEMKGKAIYVHMIIHTYIPNMTVIYTLVNRDHTSKHIGV